MSKKKEMIKLDKREVEKMKAKIQDLMEEAKGKQSTRAKKRGA